MLDVRVICVLWLTLGRMSVTGVVGVLPVVWSLGSTTTGKLL